MIIYKVELKMADKTLKIDNHLKSMIIACAKEASSTTVSRKYRRTFTVEENQPDEYTVIIKIASRDSINPTRTMSTLTRAVARNPDYYNLVKDHIVNGLIFHTRLISEENGKIITMTDTKIVSEILSIFFDNDMSEAEKELASTAAKKIRPIVLEFVNKRIDL